MDNAQVSVSVPGWSVHVPGVTAPEFLSRLEARGWPAEEAFIAYKEWRQFAGPGAARQNSSAALLIQTRQRLGDFLETPSDLQRYLEHFPRVALGHPWPQAVR